MVIPSSGQPTEEMQAVEGQPSSFHIKVDQGTVREVRKRVMVFARSLSFSPSALGEIEMAVGEAALNAVRHGSPLGQANVLHVHSQALDGRYVIEITDQGCGFFPAVLAAPVAEEMKSGGYGLWLMRGLMDEIAFVPAPEGGTTVRLVKRYRPMS